jgi:hypothetical protein
MVIYIKKSQNPGTQRRLKQKVHVFEVSLGYTARFYLESPVW